jgi:hypothetical protein
MAEVLTSPDDEVLFVDYATPLGMPTLPEAIKDTLTDRAIERMRVFRVAPELHAKAVGGRSRLPISEPHARNTAIRRARAGNWILSTNTDMVFVPKAGRSLTEVVSDLTGDAYCLPRFEIPEWLWESVPRTHPGQMIGLLDEWGERIGLDEVTLGHDWILYDAPGDFQLLRRGLIDELHGFDEDMIHGWHVDSNLWKRVYNKIGEIGTLYPDIAGYHTNHNRTLTRLMAAQPTGNDLGRFVYGVEHAELPAQADTWGFAHEDVHEIRLTAPDPLPLLRAAAARGTGQTGPLITSDTREQMSVLTYDARHILPFALDPVIGEYPRASVGYVGINESTADMLARATADLGCPGRLAVDQEAANADIVVLDLGVDASTGRGPLTRDEAECLLSALRRAISKMRVRDPRPRILLINAISGVWDEWVRAQFNLSYGTFHTRIQPAELRGEGADGAIDDGVRRRLAFVTRDREAVARCIASPEEEVFSLIGEWDYSGLTADWESVDEAGAYAGSTTSRANFRTTGAVSGPTHITVEMATWTTTDGPIAPFRMRVSLDEQVLFDGVPPTVAQIVNLHAVVDLGARSEHELAIKVTMDDGASYNPRMAGGAQPWVRLGAVKCQLGIPPAMPRDTTLPMSPGSTAEACLRGIWTKTNPYGAWSLGPVGTLFLQMADDAQVVALELLGHPARGNGQSVRITAVGDSEVTTEVHGISSTTPEDYLVRLPQPCPDGAVTIVIEPSGPPAQSGEVVELRSVRLVTSA